jgi:hypothetical protein
MLMTAGQNVMSSYTNGREEAQEDDVLTRDISDEALEMVAHTGDENVEHSTFGWCTYVNICRCW